MPLMAANKKERDGRPPKSMDDLLEPEEDTVKEEDTVQEDVPVKPVAKPAPAVPTAKPVAKPAPAEAPPKKLPVYVHPHDSSIAFS